MMASAKEISEDAATAVVSPELDGIFTVKSWQSWHTEDFFWWATLFLYIPNRLWQGFCSGSQTVSHNNKSDSTARTWTRVGPPNHLPKFFLPFPNAFIHTGSLNGNIGWIQTIQETFHLACQVPTIYTVVKKICGVALKLTWIRLKL